MRIGCFLYRSPARTNMAPLKAKGENSFSDRIEAFQLLAQKSTPALDDKIFGKDRCLWRIAFGYLRAMNKCENSKQFKTPKSAAIDHGLDHDLVLAARAFETPLALRIWAEMEPHGSTSWAWTPSLGPASPMM